MSGMKIDCSPFTLPFMKDGHALAIASGKYDEEGAKKLSPTKLLKFLKEAVPETAIALDEVDGSVQGWTEWRIHDYFYVLRVDGSEYEWALFRITFDDNWGRYGWSGEVRASGCPDVDSALGAMVPAMFKSWGMDVAESEDHPYAQFFNRCTRGFA